MADQDLLRFLPEDRVGVVQRIEPITMGLSGASVHAVTTSRGAYVLRATFPRGRASMGLALLALGMPATEGEKP